MRLWEVGSGARVSCAGAGDEAIVARGAGRRQGMGPYHEYCCARHLATVGCVKYVGHYT